VKQRAVRVDRAGGSGDSDSQFHTAVISDQWTMVSKSAF